MATKGPNFRTFWNKFIQDTGDGAATGIAFTATDFIPAGAASVQKSCQKKNMQNKNGYQEADGVATSFGPTGGERGARSPPAFFFGFA